MNSNRLVLNTLVAQAAHDAGSNQEQLVEDLLSSGINNIELRREYGNATINELDQLSELGKRDRLTYFYSVPDNLFVNQQLNVKLLQYVAEAQRLGAGYIKMTLGDYNDAKPDCIDELLTVIPTSIQLNIENDQTTSNSDTGKLVLFFKQFDRRDRKVGFVNDLGNWIFTNQDALTATNTLLPYTRFIHLKGFVLNQDGNPETVSFVQGKLDWWEILRIFPTDLPIALEYPADADMLNSDISKLLNN
ncbi:sugar phosphate isomerase [Lentilactobacillus buchneri]|uniref:Sugar phosphate isomerase/epimerase n=1 Tax=Lentilactobacillus buchneri subsp. silagei CD034 TaxID=1071400 RepID=J9W4H8_LENBU|nr:sugar phosphate isomerase [Lentilactobacillus buchneri]MCC6100665.1 sugar phosphate isomerase [Lactobacillus sp.]AFR99170.1 sugar phosphate isomerase/epimerase [Lentilactobacillus buchneri subsp. silagei CD034]BEJ52703.1 hypothetical protein Ltb232_08790 [Lentilactobacillus buchneri subsp. silagei]GED91138.1 sugar phosphate isomerase [Lentilactobacillus buchneri subsp. silagei]GED94139.1 sugar phosphate isomerase [Lentilactobacillus buchneri subsp. silagei]